MQNKRSKAEKNGSDYELPKRVGILYSDVRRDYFPTESLYITEKDAEKEGYKPCAVCMPK